MQGVYVILVFVVALLPGCTGSAFSKGSDGDQTLLPSNPSNSAGASGGPSTSPTGDSGTPGTGGGGGLTGDGGIEQTPVQPPPPDLCEPPQFEASSCGVCEDCTQLPDVDPEAVSCSETATCVISNACASGFADCDGETVNGCETLLRSPRSCGSCANDCVAQAAGLPNVAAAATGCDQGECKIQCAEGFADCNGRSDDGCEVSLATRENCGECGEGCDGSFVCVANLDRFTCESACPPGQMDCGGSCVDPQSSGSHCGVCGNKCDASQNAEAACVAGSCTFAGCVEGFGNCDGRDANGCEVNLRTDKQHCGDCGNKCSFPGAGALCTNGTCKPGGCANGRGNCDKQESNGCEVTLASAARHCGACGNDCFAAAHVANARCERSSCSVRQCKQGYRDCDGKWPNGCEAQLNFRTTCGSCDNNCEKLPGVNRTRCDDNRLVCLIDQCKSGRGNCDGNPKNGCETNLSNSKSHCGQCGKRCQAPAGGSARCANGSCKSSCPNGRKVCGGACVNTAADQNHCGACGNRCGAGETCRQGDCSPTCDTGKLCGGVCVNPQTDENNCGSCGNRCDAGEACNNGTCSLDCGAGEQACGSVCVNTQTDENHCGSCGNSCDAGEVCNNGSCRLDCGAGEQACGNACVNTQTDENHCGSCGNSCDAGEACSSGTCRLDCGAGEQACGSACVNTQTDENNCGSCGSSCDADEGCNNGTCVLVCSAGEQGCDGACVNTQTDENNCGGCGNSCTAGESCRGGTCTVVCSSGEQACGGVCVNTQTDENNCGVCGNDCAVGETCSGGACAVVCPDGEQACGKTCVDTETDENNCGSCGNVCEPPDDDPDAEPSCVDGTCAG